MISLTVSCTENKNHGSRTYGWFTWFWCWLAAAVLFQVTKHLLQFMETVHPRASWAPRHEWGLRDSGQKKQWSQPPWSMRWPWTPSEPQEVWTPWSTAQIPSWRLQRLCPQLQGVLAPAGSSAETLSGDSLWLDRAALLKATPISGAAYIQGLQILWRGRLNGCPLGPMRSNSYGPRQCQSSCL